MAIEVNILQLTILQLTNTMIYIYRFLYMVGSSYIGFCFWQWFARTGRGIEEIWPADLD